MTKNPDVTTEALKIVQKIAKESSASKAWDAVDSDSEEEIGQKPVQ